MNKQTLLYTSIAAIVLLIVGSAVANSHSNYTVGLGAEGLGYIAVLVVWIGGMIKMVQLKRWGWFVGILIFSPLAPLLYGIFGPEAPRA